MIRIKSIDMPLSPGDGARGAPVYLPTQPANTLAVVVLRQRRSKEAQSEGLAMMTTL
jgi:hypothetical protein